VGANPRRESDMSKLIIPEIEEVQATKVQREERIKRRVMKPT